MAGGAILKSRFSRMVQSSRLSSKEFKPSLLCLLLVIFTIAVVLLFLVHERQLSKQSGAGNLMLKSLKTSCDLQRSAFKNKTVQVRNCMKIFLSEINDANEAIKVSTAKLQATLEQYFEDDALAMDLLDHRQWKLPSNLVADNNLQEFPKEIRSFPPSTYSNPSSPLPLNSGIRLTADSTQHSAATVCHKWLKKHGVKPREDWGTLPMEYQQRWYKFNCDCILIGHGCPSSSTHAESVTRSITREGIIAAVARRPPDSRLPCPPPPASDNAAAAPPHRCTHNAAAAAPATAAAGRLPVVAVLVPTSSRGRQWANVTQSYVVTHSLPSLLRHAEAGFEYRFYVGYDSDDALYTRDDVRRDLVAWLERALAAVPHPASAALAEFDNELRKPGPVFNFLSMAAVADGADYIYRINDDTVALDPYPAALVEALQHMSPPLLGVAAPECMQGNRDVLTHDFVHRTHVTFFGLHYPSSLPDWWMDDWITLVYPRNNTARLAAVNVQHHTSSSGPRYSVNYQNYHHLRAAVVSARQALREHVTRSCQSSSLGIAVGHGDYQPQCPPAGW